jgi:hypothetical protein
MSVWQDAFNLDPFSRTRGLMQGVSVSLGLTSVGGGGGGGLSVPDGVLSLVGGDNDLLCLTF